MFSCEFCEIFKNIISTEYLRATFSVSYENYPPATLLRTVLRGEFRALELFAKIVHSSYTAQKMKFSIKDFFSKCDKICRNLHIWSHLLKKSLSKNFIFCAVLAANFNYFFLRYFQRWLRLWLWSWLQFTFTPSKRISIYMPQKIWV